MNNNLNLAERVAKMLLDIKAVTLSPKAPYKYVSGMLSPIYTDNRLLMGYPLKRREITIYMANMIKEYGLEPEIIAGTSTAGIPPAAWLAELLSLPMIYIRGETKDHGKGKRVEGIIKRETNIILIEDLISTGQSSLGAIDAIRKEGGKIDTCLAFFNYGFKDTIQKYKKQKINLYTLTTLDDLVAVARKLGLITTNDVKLIIDWQKDPWGWTKKRQKKEQKTVEY